MTIYQGCIFFKLHIFDELGGGDEKGTSKGKFFPWFLLLFAKKNHLFPQIIGGKTFEKISTPLKHLQLPVGKLFSKRGGN